MFVPIPLVFRVHTATASGAAWKEVHCSNCGCDYLYLLKAVASAQRDSPFLIGGARASAAAAAEAESKLAAALAEGHDLAACPDCGWYQPEMIQADKRRRAWRMRVGIFLIDFLLFIIAFVLFMIDRYSGPQKPWKFSLWPDGPTVSEVVQRIAIASAIIWTLAGLLFVPLWLRRGDYNRDAEGRRSGKPGPEGPFRRQEWLKYMQKRAEASSASDEFRSRARALAEMFSE